MFIQIPYLMKSDMETKEIIGRDKEKEKLQKAFFSKESEFIAVYGRRRIGKTFLIRHFFSKQKGVFFQVSGIHYADLKVQLKEFKKEIERAFYNEKVELKAPDTWMEAFEMLTNSISMSDKNKKIVLFLDEFPWMATRKSGLLQALDYFWNRFWVDLTNVKLIICGSAASWIIKNILNNKGGLHNRVTLKLNLEPFSLHETKLYLKYLGVKLDNYQILTLYMCIGGVPFYLKSIEKGLSAVQNINHLCFKKDGLLATEFKELFTSLFEERGQHETLIKLIASKRNGISRVELEKHIQHKGGTLTSWLKELETAGFISSFLSFGKERGTYYKIIDEYTLFYLTWVHPNSQSRLQKEITSHYWEIISQTPAWKAWSGYAFESICYKHINNIQKALNVPEGSSATTWRYVPPKKIEEEGAQIDLLFDRPDSSITLCEIKYSSDHFVVDKAEAKELLRKKSVYQKIMKTKKHIFVSMITASRLKKNMYSEELIDSEATLDDLFNC